MERAEVLLRVERGHASEEELAALAAVLGALRRSGREVDEEPVALPAAWWERPAGYVAPGSWR
ncbi:acyl-CoA carboxylase epsilon subunit [Streptomyces sp. NPDC012466]|jgi:Ser/Thr protein kinase RdoA (MazF antagonist)|uniref:acyl-CoA carboxylase epsilon subunit n=1 Tax=Streptomyces sp. NPDC012466 TaxID=3364835 RepID=UPI0036EE7F37